MAQKPKTVITDLSIMPFGKHKDVAMANVPASYLDWFYETYAPIIDYIRENKDAIDLELNNKNNGNRY